MAPNTISRLLLPIHQCGQGKAANRCCDAGSAERPEQEQEQEQKAGLRDNHLEIYRNGYDQKISDQ